MGGIRRVFLQISRIARQDIDLQFGKYRIGNRLKDSSNFYMRHNSLNIPGYGFQIIGRDKRKPNDILCIKGIFNQTHHALFHCKLPDSPSQFHPM